MPGCAGMSQVIGEAGVAGRDALTAVVDKIYWYDGVLEVLVKGEEYLRGEEPESLINID